MDLRFLLTLSLVAYGCEQSTTGQVHSGKRSTNSIITPAGKTIKERFSPPAGFERKSVSVSSFGYYLRGLPLKKHGSTVLYYNGQEKTNDDIYSGVVAMDIGNKDLQQCADAVMRLQAEYLYKTGQAKNIHFNFTNGFNAKYSLWMDGQRISVRGNNVSWVAAGQADNSYTSFRKYMDMVFLYAGTLSLSRELEPVEYEMLSIGDVFIQGGSPGHAVIVVDVAENAAGKKVYLLAQSYMPAQETQILNNPMNKDISPWYELDETEDVIQTPQWRFHSGDLKRFAK